VKIVVDANIVFSGILNTNSKIADILIHSDLIFDFISPNFLRYEISKNYTKLVKISKLTLNQIKESEYQICKNITFISEESIDQICWIDAEKIVKDVDPKDVTYVAYSEHFKCKLWSGDKKLLTGIRKKGFINVISTDEMQAFRDSLK
jgi:predicted nucleic acid-binding protein